MARGLQHKRAVYFVVFLILLVCTISLWVTNFAKGESPSPLSFSVPFGDEVALRIITAEHYGLDDDEEWGKILPAGGHLVYTAEEGSASPKPHTVTLFHQQKCLAIIRSQYKLPPSTPITPRIRHCMNYLRQTILCRPNLRLESVEDERGLTDRYFYDTVCRDWTTIYMEAERNQLAYAKWKEEIRQGDL